MKCSYKTLNEAIGRKWSSNVNKSSPSLCPYSTPTLPQSTCHPLCPTVSHSAPTVPRLCSYIVPVPSLCPIVLQYSDVYPYSTYLSTRATVSAVSADTSCSSIPRMTSSTCSPLTSHGDPVRICCTLTGRSPVMVKPNPLSPRSTYS